MRFMRWSWAEYLAAPMPLIDAIHEMVEEMNDRTYDDDLT